MRVALIMTVLTVIFARELGWVRKSMTTQQVLAGAALDAFPLGAQGPEIRWLGHAGFWIDWKGTVVVIDPNLNGHCTLARRWVRAPMKPRELGHVDAVLLSHAHSDHLDPWTLERIPKPEQIIGPEFISEFLGRSIDNETIRELAPYESTPVGSLSVTAVPAKHNGSRYHPFSSRHGACGYVIGDGQTNVYIAGDTAFFPGIRAIASRYGPRLAILPIGAYSPRFPLSGYHMSPREAAQTGILMGVEKVIPSHFGTFRLSLDRPASALPRFMTEAEHLGLAWVMAPFAYPENMN